MLRKLMFEVAKANDFNFSSSYGLQDNCGIPNSCTRGSHTRITYGHEIDVDAVLSSTGGVLVSMFREPTSWLFSRWKHGYKFNKQIINIVQAAKNYGPKYFNFADTKTKMLLNSIFDQVNRDNKTTAELQNSIDTAIGMTRKLFQDKCVVLVFDQLNASVRHMAHMLDNNALNTLFLSKYCHVPINAGPQDKYIDNILTDQSPDAFKTVKAMLFLHSLIYNEAVDEFRRQLQFTAVSLQQRKLGSLKHKNIKTKNV